MSPFRVPALVSTCLLLTSLSLAAPQSHAVEDAYAWLRSSRPFDVEVEPIPALPAPHITIRNDWVEVVAGPKPRKLPLSTYPLALAIRTAEELVKAGIAEPVIGVYGAVSRGLSGVQIGGGDAGEKAYRADWGDDPMRFMVRGMTPDARITTFSLHEKIAGVDQGGVERATFVDLTIEAAYESCVRVDKGAAFGELRLWRCRLVGNTVEPHLYFDFGFKWGVRSRGLGAYDFRQVVCEPVLEHAFYLDSPQGECLILDCVTQGSTRTSVQIVSRAFDDERMNPSNAGVDESVIEWNRQRYLSGEKELQIPGYGTILVRGCDFAAPYHAGGSAITIAGFLGDAAVVDCRVTAPDPEVAPDFQKPDGELEDTHGALVCYTNATQHHGAFLYTGVDGRPYSMRTLAISGLTVDLASSDRDFVSITGVERTYVGPFFIRGNRHAMVIENPDLANTWLANDVAVLDGVVVRSPADFYVENDMDGFRFFLPGRISRWSGWSAFGKMKRRGVDGHGADLTDQEIDALSWTGALFEGQGDFDDVAERLRSFR